MKTGEKQELAPENTGRVISEDTAKNVLSMMQAVVAEGTGKNAQVPGYNVGGKTGTSEDGVNTNKYVTSFIGVAPISNPKVTILVTLYNPTGEGGHQGGAVAAPVAGKVLGEVLPYLELNHDNKENIEDIKTVTVPDITYKTIKEAEEILKEKNLKLEYKGDVDKDKKEEIIIKEQIPAQGIKVNEDSKIFVKY